MVIPLTGLTTPFMAAGGSSMLANWLVVALVLMVSQSARRPVAVGPMVNASGAGSGHLDPAAGPATPESGTPVNVAPGGRTA